MDKQKGDKTTVFLVRRNDAKKAKGLLDNEDVLDKDFRMTPSLVADYPEAVAIPILAEQMNSICWSEGCMPFKDLILAQTEQFCPFSTNVLGNKHGQRTLKGSRPSLVEQALISAMRQSHPELEEKCILEEMQRLPLKLCPKHLEVIGDDRTVVIPPRALSLRESVFSDWMDAVSGDRSKESFIDALWEKLALFHKSSRIVRKGEIRPESGIRESNFEILWLKAGDYEQTGPGSPGWITVTEQGIRQSFDLTRVMFSRGNITEKARFGKLVQPGEIVLDLYAGIGYFTLPALLIGKARHVYACEWNDQAIQALQYNLKDNQVAGRATVFHGDSRSLLMQHSDLNNSVDRVSLGLIPSSEGGWETAIRALKQTTGGWLHIHGNVPVKEADNWTLWVCSRLAFMVEKKFQTASCGQNSIREQEWVVACSHLERVKSFAPTVNHYVADVFVGPKNRLHGDGHATSMQNPQNGWVGMILQEGRIVGIMPKDAEVMTPSCALSSDGPLHQPWMFPE